MSTILRLNGSVNADILKIGEIRIKQNIDTPTYYFSITCNAESEFKTIDEGTVFFNSQQPLVRSRSLSKEKLSKAGWFSIIDKSNITVIELQSDFSIKLEELSSECDSLQSLYLGNGATIIKDTEYLDLGFLNYLNADVFNRLALYSLPKTLTFNVSGDITIINKFKNFTDLTITDNIPDTSNALIYGDLSLIKNFPNLKQINIKSENLCSWTTERDSSYNLLPLLNINFKDYDLDAMLINQSKCPVSSAANKTLSVYGNSAYKTDVTVQNAITSLREKGITVLINALSPEW